MFYRVVYHHAQESQLFCCCFAFKNLLFYLIIENSRGSSDSHLKQPEQRQICIVVDGLAANLSFEDARIHLLSDAEGYSELAAKLQEGTLSLAGYKLIILLLGRGDMQDTDRQFLNGVERVITLVQCQNELAIVVLAATLPSTLDTIPMINSFTFRNDKLATICHGSDRLEHARPGKHLLGPRRPVRVYYDDYGNINELGCDVVARALERKLFSARLLQKWELLRQKSEEKE